MTPNSSGGGNSQTPPTPAAQQLTTFLKFMADYCKVAAPAKVRIDPRLTAAPVMINESGKRPLKDE
jgi:hypothetical protein